MAAKTELPSLQLQRKTYAQTLYKARRENPVSFTKAEYTLMRKVSCFMNRRNTDDELAKTARSSRIAAIWLDAPPCHLRISNTLGSVPGNCRPGAVFVLFSRGGSCQPSLGAGAGIVRHSFGRIGDLVFPPRTTILIH